MARTLLGAEELNRQAASRIESMQSTILRFESEAELRINTLQARINQLTEALNKEQIEISKAYEKMPNPALLATQEFMEDKVYFRKNEEDLFR